jgi:RNA polymerase sigma factor (sigma-70 family)
MDSSARAPSLLRGAGVELGLQCADRRVSRASGPSRCDRKARNALIERHLPLERALALRYRRSPEEIEDLVQVASLGLVKAVDWWDRDRGVAFTRFAVPTVLGELQHHLRDNTWCVRRGAASKICLSRSAAREESRAQRPTASPRSRSSPTASADLQPRSPRRYWRAEAARLRRSMRPATRMVPAQMPPSTR